MITVTLGDYEIRLEARRIAPEGMESDLFNRHDTQSVLVDLACIAWDAEDGNMKEGYEGSAAMARKYAHDLSRAWRSIRMDK